MQLHRFSNGGFVIHRVLVDGRHGANAETGPRVSAWYAADGGLLDYERRDRLGRPCRASRAILKRLESMGRVHASIDPVNAE